MPPFRFAASLLLVVSALAACRPERAADSPAAGSGGARAPAAALTLAFEGKVVAEVPPDELLRISPPVEVTVMDPVYKKTKRFRALPLRPILEARLGTWQPLADRDFLLRAKDGFTMPVSGSRLLEDGALLAFADLDLPGWEPVGPTRANPAPYYLIWSRPEQQNTDNYPRPYQLARIEIASIEQVFPHVVPTGAAPGSPAARGFATFRARCLVCHCINREGGRVGPDLNVPRSIVEYRPAEQIRAYIRNPLAFRYGHMPAHADLADAALDDLLAYFAFMKDHKWDPEAPRPDGGLP